MKKRLESMRTWANCNVNNCKIERKNIWTNFPLFTMRFTFFITHMVPTTNNCNCKYCSSYGMRCISTYLGIPFTTQSVLTITHPVHLCGWVPAAPSEAATDEIILNFVKLVLVLLSNCSLFLCANEIPLKLENNTMWFCINNAFLFNLMWWQQSKMKNRWNLKTK